MLWSGSPVAQMLLDGVSGEVLRDLVLRVVGVLVFVDQDVAEAHVEAFDDVRVFLQHQRYAHQQVVEVHRVALLQELFVGLVYAGDCVRVGEVGALGEFVGPLEPILRPADDVLGRLGPHEVFADAAEPHGLLDDAQAVGFVVDAEAGRDAGERPELAYEPHAEGVEGVDPHSPADAERLDAAFHLVGGLVGEGDGEDVAGRHAGLHEVRRSAGDDAGLAAAGAGDYQERAVAVRDGAALRLVQVGQAGRLWGARGHGVII